MLEMPLVAEGLSADCLSTECLSANCFQKGRGDKSG